MKFLAATLAVALVALPVAVKSQLLTFAAFNYLDCQGAVQEEWQSTGPGYHLANFGAPRYSFEVVATNLECELIVYTGLGQTGTAYALLAGEPDYTCQWTSPDTGYRSFDVYCT